MPFSCIIFIARKCVCEIEIFFYSKYFDYFLTPNVSIIVTGSLLWNNGYDGIFLYSDIQKMHVLEILKKGLKIF